MSKSFYKLEGFWWSCLDLITEPHPYQVDGPYCISCYSDLHLPDSAYEFSPEVEDFIVKDSWSGETYCRLCEKSYKMKKNLGEIKEKVSLILRSNYRARLTKASLEEPITQVKVRDQDDTYFLAAKVGQKDGKRVGVVYFGEKAKDQKKEDYSQIFIDLDDEQLRFDKSNKHPKEILAKFKVEFREGDSISTFRSLKGR